MSTYEGTRKEIADASRVVVKVGSSSLTTPTGLNTDALQKVARTLAEFRLNGKEVILVSSGAVAAGMGPMKAVTRPKDLATQQAAAGIGQGILMSAYFSVLAEYGLVPAQVLLTADELIRRTQYRNAQRAIDRMLALGFMPIVNENDAVATSEIRFGDNDRLSALVAQLSHADALVLLTDVDALYTAHPADPDSQRVAFVSHPNEIAKLDIGGAGSTVGTGGMRTKVQAATMVTDSGIPTLVTSADNCAAALRGEDVGTYFAVTHKRRQTRMLWLAHLASTNGTIRVDAGAAKAVLKRGTSLLAAGVTHVTGEFESGDPVDIVDPQGDLIARGMTNFSSEELPRMYGLTTEVLGDRYGSDYRKEVVHRNDLVLTDSAYEGRL